MFILLADLVTVFEDLPVLLNKTPSRLLREKIYLEQRFLSIFL